MEQRKWEIRAKSSKDTLDTLNGMYAKLSADFEATEIALSSLEEEDLGAVLEEYLTENSTEQDPPACPKVLKSKQMIIFIYA